ncbi:hypothetical protein [Actinomadura rubrobrunea]|uniref:hypothetical protein n=1 Tax=Actinomadura rubrobrunea TaxID=115335 RepID=UPI0011B1FA74|nr:hypothetical protein [Actinomadura rubrobrunea]
MSKPVSSALIAGVFLTLAVNACDGGRNTAQSTVSADLAPVRDRVPYLCDLVPEVEFRRVTGLTMQLSAQWNGPQKDSGLCVAHAKGRQPPLGIQWDFDDGEKVLRENRPSFPDSAHTLPADLGTGFARPDSIKVRPNYVISLFRCGDKQPWLSIDFAPVVRGRDPVQDMFAFMRIAQNRFGELHKCTPRP